MSDAKRQAHIEPDAHVPAIHITRDFSATPDQLFRAHTDPELFARWVGPTSRGAEIDYWRAVDGGSWRYVAPTTTPGAAADSQGFRGCFHTVRPDRIVQTFTWEGMPDQVALETLTFTDVGDGHTRLHAISLSDSFETRDQWLRSGMETGLNEGYAALDMLIAEMSA